MAGIYMICLVFVLSVAVVQCAAPKCTPPTCRAGKTCKWTCEKNGHQIANVTDSICTNVNVTCAGTGQCKATCVAASATCPCPEGQPCKWTCKKSDNAPINDAYIIACTSDGGPCGSQTENGTCKAACPSTNSSPKTTTPVNKEKNGSIRHGLSPLILLCGLFTKLSLRL